MPSFSLCLFRLFVKLCSVVCGSFVRSRQSHVFKPILSSMYNSVIILSVQGQFNRCISEWCDGQAVPYHLVAKEVTDLNVTICGADVCYVHGGQFTIKGMWESFFVSDSEPRRAILRAVGCPCFLHAAGGQLQSYAYACDLLLGRHRGA